MFWETITGAIMKSSRQNKREYDEAKQQLLGMDYEDFEDDSRFPNDDSPSLGSRVEFLNLLASIGLCFSIIYVVFNSFVVLIGTVVFDNILSIILMVLSVIYVEKCPAETQLPPTCFAYGFTCIVKSILAVWNNKAYFKPRSSSASSEEDETDVALYGKKFKLIVYNGLQLLSFGFYIYAWILLIDLHSTVGLGLDASSVQPQPSNASSPSNSSKIKPYCDPVFVSYSISFLSLHTLYIIIFLLWIPFIIKDLS